MIDCNDNTAGKLFADRLSTATELLGGWVWETDAQHRFTYVSDNIERMIGRPASYFLGKTRQEAGNNCDRSQLAAFEKSLEARAAFSTIDFSREDNGDVIHMRITGKPVVDANDIFIGYRGVAYRTTSEVLERERRLAAERARSDTGAILNAVVDSYPNPIVIFDQGLAIVHANASYYTTLELNADKFPVGTTMQNIVTELIDRGEIAGGDPATLVEHHIRMARSREEWVFERSRPNGSTLRVHQVPLPIGGIMRTFTDVTERIEDKWAIHSLKNTVAAMSDERRKLNQSVQTRK